MPELSNDDAAAVERGGVVSRYDVIIEVEFDCWSHRSSNSCASRLRMRTRSQRIRGMNISMVLFIFRPGIIEEHCPARRACGVSLRTRESGLEPLCDTSLTEDVPALWQ